MGETRKLAAILVADVVGYSRLAAVDEDRTLARLRGVRARLKTVIPDWESGVRITICASEGLPAPHCKENLAAPKSCR